MPAAKELFAAFPPQNAAKHRQTRPLSANIMHKYILMVKKA
jgi:hypothetical protein